MMDVVTDLANWKSRAADLDPAVAAEVWTDPSAPASVLRDPPAAVVEFLLGDGAWQGSLSAVVRNPALPMSVLATLATRAKGHSRATISRHVLRSRANVPQLIAAAPAITAAELGKAVDGLLNGWEHRQDPSAAQTTLAKLLRAFTTSSNVRCRALAAQAFPLIVGPRHRYSKGEVSATILIADPEVAVLVALARNYHMRSLPESEQGLAVRRALLDNASPRVRAAARRAGLHVLDSHIFAALSAADGQPVPVDAAASGMEMADPLDDPAPSVRMTAITNGISEQDGARWARVLADPSPQVRKAAATRGYFTPSFVWAALAKDPDPAVRAAVAHSRWAPAELQRRLLSDVDPKVATAAEARDPLSRPVGVRPSLPADGEVMLPVSFTHDQQLRRLDFTAVTLNLTQQHHLAIAARTTTEARAEARARVIARLGTSRAARWVADRWERWCDVFAVPAPAHSMIGLERRLAAPFVGAATADDRVTSALALFDAVLGLAAAPGFAVPDHRPEHRSDALHASAKEQNEQEAADLALLTGPWEQVLLPTPVTVDTVYGPRTPAARRLLTTAARLPRARLDSVLTTRISIDDQRWRSARREAVDAVAGPHDQVYAAHFLFWDAVTAAELAAWQRPTDPLLADALWAAGAVVLYGEQMSAATVEILTSPCAAAGLLL
ncbi:hypothetical protein [Actinomadura sp. 3N407]|uniref:hypothetical protein n=1 Tax=Actinomadura sp. 3N407 TaxID=3457423 RepID=UPI003FCCFB7F